MCLALAVMVSASGCSTQKAGPGTQPTAGAKAELQGTLRVSGAWALYPMMVKWAEEFQKLHPQVKVDVSAGGAGKGVVDALGGMVDLGMVSRDIKPEEVKQGAVYVPVVKDAVFPGINAANPVAQALLSKGIVKQTFVDLWMQGKALTWGVIAGSDSKDLVQVYTRSDSCGAADTWAKYLGGVQEDLKGTAVYGDPGLAEAVRQDPLGIGYNNLNYAYDAKTGLPVAGILVVPIDVNGNGKVDPEEDISTKSKALQAIASGAYPSPPARELYLMAKDRFSGLTKEFVGWILTDGQKYVDETGYIQLLKPQMDAALKKLEGQD
jgi:phosphate transport system substrate-binding protein